MKFSVKKFAMAVLAVAGLTLGAFGVGGCRKNAAAPVVTGNVEITKTPAPQDGSLPTDHTGAENLAYIAAVLDSQTVYHSYGYTVTNASIATQETRTWKDYRDGVLITSDITYSSMVKSGSQTCTVVNGSEGEPEVYFRESEVPESSTTNLTAKWNEGAPVYFTEKAFNTTYGLLQTELSSYIINSESILSSSDVSANQDGTFTQSFVLDPVLSTYYYQYGMKTRGGLAGYPTFESVELTATFDSSWRILTLNTRDVANVNKGVKVRSVSDTVTTFSYGGQDFDEAHFAYYDNYYRNYIGDDSLEEGGNVQEDLVLDVTSVLSNGFAKILGGGDQFRISVNLGNNTYVGYLFAGLDLEDIAGTLNIKLSLGRSYDEQTLYIEYAEGDLSAYYGKDFALSANLAETKFAVEELGSFVDELASSLGQLAEEATKPEGENGEGGDMLADLMQQFTLVARENSASLSLVSDDLLGLGLGIDAGFEFGVSGNSVTFRSCRISSLSLGGQKLDISLNLKVSDDEIISHDKTSAPADLADYIADINSLLASDLIKFTVSLDGTAQGVTLPAVKGLKATLDTYLDIRGITAGADIALSYNYKGVPVSATAGVWYDYDPASGGYGKATVILKQLNGRKTDLGVKCDVKQVADAVSAMLTYSGAPLGTSTDGLASLINGALSADISPLISGLYGDSSRIKLDVDADTLLSVFGIDAGFSAGTLSLCYERGANGVNGGRLAATLPAVGLSVSAEGADGQISLPDDSDCLDLAYLLQDLQAFMNAECYKATISFDGSAATGLGLGELSGLNATLTAWFNASDVALGANAAVSYTYAGSTISADLSVWFDYAAQTTGNIYVRLNSLNGKGTDISVKCNISELAEAVKSLLTKLEVNTDFSSEMGGQTSDILVRLLSADFARLLPGLTGSTDGLYVSVNADYLLEILGANIGITFGNVALSYDHADCSIGVAAPALGLNALVTPSEQGMEGEKPADAQDLADLVEFADNTVGRVNEIISQQKMWISMEEGETFVTADGITAQLWGEAEISWKKDDSYVALDLTAKLSEESEDVTRIMLVYMDNPADGVPAIRLIINDVGIDVYPQDIQQVSDGFSEIYNAVSGLISPAQPASTAPLAEKQTAAEDTDALLAVLFKALASADWVDLLDDITLNFDSQSLLLTYLKENALGLEVTEDGLALDYSGKVADMTLGGRIAVNPGSAQLISAIDNLAASGNYEVVSSADGNAPFTKLVYDFLFDAIDSVPIEGILGSDTYAINFELNGNNSNFAELKDVAVSAALYITAEQGEGGKVAEADLTLDVKGVKVALNVIAERMGGETYFYINLSQVLNVKLPDLKVMATQSGLYETISVLLKTVTDTDVMNVIGTLLPTSQLASAEVPAVQAAQVDDGTVSKLADVLEKVLGFNFSSAFVATRTGDITTATVDLDNIASQLGLDAVGLGRINAEINHKYHTVKTSAMADIALPEGGSEQKCWLSLMSEKTQRRDYSSLDRNEYISIDFLPDFIDDLVKFATDDNGNLYGSFTFEGSISANIVGLVKINIDISTLTFSYNEGQGVYFTLIGNLSGSLVSSNTIGITYQDGYLTLARNLQGNPEYKVMTFAYFVDNMFATDGTSTLNYLLGISDSTWNLVIGMLGDLVKLDSGITKPEDIFLYTARKQDAEEEISLYDYVEGLRVMIGGEEISSMGDFSGIESDLGISDNYYGVSLNAGVLTDGVLTKLVAAIVRDDVTGISGIKAAGAIQSYVTFSANLSYREGLTPADSYVTGTPLTQGRYAPSLYAEACAMADAAGVAIEFDHYYNNVEGGYAETFGCFSTADMKNYYSHELYSHTLTIEKLDGSREELTVRHGSSIYTYDNSSPVYNADGTRLLYSFSASGEPAPAVFTLDGDAVLYEIRRASVNVYIINGSETLLVNSFAGDDVPLTADGLSSLGAVEYKDGGIVQAGDKVPDGITELWLVGTFVATNVDVNDVTYTFDAATLSYVASGRAAGFNDRYSVKGETLVLENEIGGYPVTAIADYAFANTSGKPVKNVVVPANIVTVGRGAFLDNNGMESIAFLADSVTLLGTQKDKNTPFYGCSVSATDEKVDGVKQNEVTNLHVYYTDIQSEDGNWRFFRTVTAVIITYNFYIGDNGGGVHQGGWQYVRTETHADCVEETDLSALVSNRFAPELVIGSYSGLGAVNDFVAEQLSRYKNENGKDKYVAEITMGSDDAGFATVIVNVSLNVPATVTIYSPVAMTYGGKQIPANEYVTADVQKTGDEIELIPGVADGYTFLGWAVEEDGKLVFAGRTCGYSGDGMVLYAVWGASKVQSAFTVGATAAGSGALPAVTGAVVDGNWYDSQWNRVTELSKQSLLVYTRSQFTFTFNIKGNIITKIKDSEVGYSSWSSNYSRSISVAEGQRLEIVHSGDKTLDIYIDGSHITTLSVSTFKFELTESLTYDVTENIGIELKY